MRNLLRAIKREYHAIFPTRTQKETWRRITYAYLLHDTAGHTGREILEYAASLMCEPISMSAAYLLLIKMQGDGHVKAVWEPDRPTRRFFAGRRPYAD